MTTEEVRRRWPEVLEALRASPVTWSLVSANAQVSELGRDVLHLAFPSPGLARTFSSPRHTGAVQDVVYQTLGLQVRVEARLDEGGPTGGGPAAPSAPAADTPPPAPASAPSSAPSPAPAASAPSGSPASGGGAGGGSSTPLAVVGAPAGGTAPAAPPRASAAAAGAPESAASRGAVALQERPVVDAADEAWLAGLPAEPPADLDEAPEPEPVLERAPAARPDPGATARDAAAPPASTTPRATGAPATTSRQEAPARPAPPAAPATASGAPLRGVSAARAAIAAATTARAARPTEEPAGRPAPSTVDPMDDLPSADDPDIVSSGLVGTALVVSLLDGKIIEEIQDQGL